MHQWLTAFFQFDVKKKWGKVFEILSRDAFIICGDSLICACLERSLLGGEYYSSVEASLKAKADNFQTLSLIYQVEWFLGELKSRGSEFMVLFCDDTKKLWHGTGRLAREVVESHIRKSGTISSATIPNYGQLSALIKNYKPAFFMCKVGWRTDEQSFSKEQLVVPLSSVTFNGMHSPLLALYVRSMIMQIVCDVNVGTVVDLQLLSQNNSLAFVDESSFTGFCVYKPAFHDCSASSRALELVAEYQPKLLARGVLNSPSVDCLRLQLAMDSLKSLLEDADTLPDFEPNVCLFFAKLYLLHACLGSVLPIKCRSQNLHSEASHAQGSRSPFEHFVIAIATHLAASIHNVPTDTPEGKSTICDALDARMMQVLLKFFALATVEHDGSRREMHSSDLCGTNAPLQVRDLQRYISFLTRTQTNPKPIPNPKPTS